MRRFLLNNFAFYNLKSAFRIEVSLFLKWLNCYKGFMAREIDRAIIEPRRGKNDPHIHKTSSLVFSERELKALCTSAESCKKDKKFNVINYFTLFVCFQWDSSSFFF